MMNAQQQAWWKEAVVYQIYPRSFMDGNGDGIGDLYGVIERLDYLKSLGIDVLWLSPIYDSPNDDNGYDISNYQKIMPEFGTMDTFDELLRKAHDRHIKIMMDLVVNHTSDEHEWFQESRKDKENPYSDFYIWRDGKGEDGKLPPNNWGSSFGGSAWEYDASREQFYLHLFSKKQPDLNWENPKVREAIYAMMTWWCEKGIDGFRMDVINFISKDLSFPDGETHGGLYGDFSPYSINGPRIHEFLKEMHEKVLKHYPLMTVGEMPGVSVEQAQAYTDMDEHEVQMVFQFEHVDIGAKYGKWPDGPVPFDILKQVLNKWQVGLQDTGWNSLYWNNHDQPRVVSRFGNDREPYREKSAKMLGTCLHMMQGTPYIYQGEELGMTNYPFQAKEEFKDLESLQAFVDWVDTGRLTEEQMMLGLRLKSRDNARTPMQWSDAAQAGFSSATPWIQVNPNYLTINAQEEQQREDSVFAYYRQLIALRKAYPIIVYGTFVPLESDHRVYAYERRLDGQRLLVLCNFSEDEVVVQLKKIDTINDGHQILSNDEKLPLNIDSKTEEIRLNAYSSGVWITK